MKISIIIPVHNAEKTIESCVESFTNQNYRDLEIILIENNSEDNTLGVCHELESKYNSVRCISTKEKGVSAARNIGLDAVTGDIIGFADADDLTCADSLHLIAAAFSKIPDTDIVVTGIQKVFGNSKIRVKAFSKNRTWSCGRLRKHVIYDSRVSGYLVNKFWKRELLEGLKFRTDLTHSEDLHFVINSLSTGKCRKVYVLGKSLYSYIQTDESATAVADRMFDESGKLKLIIAAEAVLEDFKLDRFEYMLVRRGIFSMASSQYLRFRLKPEQKKILRNYMKKNISFYLMTFYVAPVETVKRLLRLITN